jgi:hypothetical protein
LVGRLNARIPGFLGQNRVVRNQFAKFSKIDEVSNAASEELFNLLPRLDWVFVSRVFASEKLKRDNPIGVPVGPRRSFSWRNLDAGDHKATRQARAFKILREQGEIHLGTRSSVDGALGVLQNTNNSGSGFIHQFIKSMNFHGFALQCTV